MSVLTQHAPREGRETGGIARGIAALAEGKLYALQHPYALDGRVSSYPASARGFSVANSYLLTQSDAAMLIDTGFGKDEPAIRAQIESLIAPALPLSLFPLRLNEFMSINNVESFAGHFNVEQCYTSNTDAALWFDFGAKAEGRDILESMKVTAVTRADTIQLGKEDRAIDVMFDKYDVETIAPGYGCILRGRNVVARHYQMLDGILKACDKSVAVSRYVTRDEER